MTLGTTEFIELALLLATIACSYGVVRQNVTRLLSDFKTTKSDVEELSGRLDTLETQVTVLSHQTKVLASILSPEELRSQNQIMAKLMAQVDYHQRDISRLMESRGMQRE